MAKAVSLLAVNWLKLKPAERVDHLYALGEARRALDKLSDEYTTIENDIKNHLKIWMPAEKISKFAGQIALATCKPVLVPIEVDWDKVWGYVIKHEATELIQNRLSLGSVQERWAAGTEIVGIKKFSTYKISPTKLTRGKPNDESKA